MKIPKYRVGMVVTIRKTDKDPGGMGRITATKSMEDEEGDSNQVRVLIDRNEKQQAAKEKKGDAFKGFWYDILLIED